MVFIFRVCPPPHLKDLVMRGFSVASLSRCPGVEHVADVRSYIEGRFVIIIGDKELAERLEVGHATVAEVEKFLLWLSKEAPAAYKPYMQ